MLVFDYELNGERFHMEVSSPPGGGGYYDIIINNYYCGMIVNAALYDKDHELIARYWRPSLNKGAAWMTGDDLSVIIDDLPPVD